MLQENPHLMTANGGGWGYHSLAQFGSARKSFFRTDGGYFGTAPDMFPDSLQSGDVIALVAGLAMPVVLRKVESGFHLVSHCYVHGMIYGDVWERVETQIVSAHTSSIRGVRNEGSLEEL